MLSAGRRLVQRHVFAQAPWSMQVRRATIVGPNRKYEPRMLEPAWQSSWQSLQKERPTPTGEKSSQPLRYILSMFPYPSGNLHMGHVRVYTISDCMARYHRMKGCQVLHPMGWDAFGLPAENAAIQRGVPPGDWTESNIQQMKQQLLSLGTSFDWDREVTTCAPSYYQWTQWLFLRLFQRGLAYQKDAYVNWDPVDKTVLANEQVDATGRSWRSGALVERRKLKQWFLKITEFSEDLLKSLDTLQGWPAQVKAMQKHWIGKSEGAEVLFPVVGGSSDQTLRVFTTRVDTLMGVTFVAVSPDHPLLIAAKEKGLLEARVKDELEQLLRVGYTKQDGGDQTVRGVRTGLMATHPLTGQPVPIFAADYVLAEYGTGAVMGVPAHDARDYRFATQYGITIRQVIQPRATATASEPAPASPVFDGDGVLIESGQFTGQSSSQAKKTIVSDLEKLQRGKRRTQYRLNDWLVSRQRYWGAPIPMIHCSDCGTVPVPEDQLPVQLPKQVKFTGEGSPLASEAASDWRNVPCPHCQKPAQRDTDTLDTFVDSSWYFLRYTTPPALQSKVAFDPTLAGRWMPVHTYIGGIEHAILHLLYARFLTRFLHSEGLLKNPEPFESLLTQGMVNGLTYKHPVTKQFVPPHDVTLESNGQGGQQPYLTEKQADGSVKKVALDTVFEKMSKSKFNGIDPKDMVSEHGADVTRLYILFKAPPEKNLDWDTAAIAGPSRFISRVWHLTHAFLANPAKATVSATSESAVREQVNVMIGEMTRQIEQHIFNTAVATMMKFLNFAEESLAKDTTLCRSPVLGHGLTTLMKLMAPFAPHTSAELYARLVLHSEGKDPFAGDVLQLAKQAKYDVHAQAWPVIDTASNATGSAAAHLIVQVGGRTRVRIPVPADKLSDLAFMEQVARQQPQFDSWMQGKAIVKSELLPVASKPTATDAAAAAAGKPGKGPMTVINFTLSE